MNDNDLIFLDTNILIYTVSNDFTKKQFTIKLLEEEKIVISTQIISESINVMYRKLNYDYSQISLITDKFIERVTLYPVNHYTIQYALNIAKKYGYSYYDSQVIASALENNCNILYSEDMQHSQKIEDKLEIINPFV